MTASASRGHAASITAAPGSSTFPSSSRSSLLDPAARQSSRSPAARLSPRARRRSGLEHGADRPARRVRRADPASRPCSSRPRASPACASSAPRTAMRRRSTRCTEPYEKFESAAPTFAAGRLFQFRIAPDGGLIALRVRRRTARSPASRSHPLPIVGSAGSVPARANGESPAREERDVAVVGVEPVEAELDPVHRLQEVLRRRRPGPC